MMKLILTLVVFAAFLVSAQEPARDITLLRGDSNVNGGSVNAQVGWTGALRESGLTHYR